jgi:hypothetical protein
MLQQQQMQPQLHAWQQLSGSRSSSSRGQAMRSQALAHRILLASQ